MPAPPVYDRDYSFTDWETTHPGEPKPGTALDTEFDDVSNALSATQDALALIQRTDGELANESVGPDQLIPGLFDGIADGISAEAEAAAAAAAASAAAAAGSASAAASSATAASTSASTASGAAATAGVSQGIAQDAANEAAASASEADASASEAELAANETAGSVAAAQLHEEMAEKWAEYLPGPVEAVDDGKFSAKWWALRAEEFNSTTDIDLGSGQADIGEAFLEWDAIPGNDLPVGEVFATWGSPPHTYVLTDHDSPEDPDSWTDITGGPGPANVLSIGTTTTLPPGSPATATITGVSPAQTLNLGIPEGVQGAIGPAGPTGPTGPTGVAGPANTLTIGTVTTGAPSAATITGAAPSQVLNLRLEAGPPNTLAIGTVTTLAPGAPATATITGTAPTQTLNLGIPQGTAGTSPTLADPTGVIGLVAVNGSAVNAMRADAAPALSQAIAPTWSAQHIFQTPPIAQGTGPRWDLDETDAAANNRRWQIAVNAEQFRMRVADDALAAVTNFITVDRTLNVIDLVAVAATAISLTGAVTTTGSLTATGIVTGSNCHIDGAAGTTRDLSWMSAGVNRWILRTGSEAESGSNAGSNFELIARDDAGASLGDVFKANRATRVLDFLVAPTIVGAAILTQTLGDARYAQLAAGNVFTVSAQRIQPASGAAALRLSPGGTSQAQLQFDGTNGFFIIDMAGPTTRMSIDQASGLVTLVGEVYSTVRYRVGSSAPVSGAAFSAAGVTAGNSLEWGHSNTAGYRSTLGYNTANGKPFVAFSAEAGTTANTFKTRGFIGNIIQSDVAGALQFGRAATANADNQSLTVDMTISATGVVDFAVAPTIAGAAFPSGGASVANPTGTIGLTAVNGSAATALRSDGAPALSQSIAPTWTGQHIFTKPWNTGVETSIPVLISSATPALFWKYTSGATDAKLWSFAVNSGQFQGQIWGDGGSGQVTWLSVSRQTITAVSTIKLTATDIHLEVDVTGNGTVRCGTNASVPGALLSAAKDGNCIEWGPAATAGGLRSMLGSNVGDTKTWIGFNAEKGTTNNTFRTRGVKGYVLRANLLGGLEFGRAPTATADNQALTVDLTISAAGVADFASTPTVAGSALILASSSPSWSGAHVFTQPLVYTDNNPLVFQSGHPGFYIYESDQTAGERRWVLAANAKVLRIAALADATSTGVDAISIARGTAQAITSITLAGIVDHTAGDVRLSARGALLDLADGYLRLNNSASYANGVYTPGTLRANQLRADLNVANSDNTKSLTWNAGGLTYGTCYVSGLVSAYCGIGAADGTINPTLMSNASSAGVYNQGDAKWLIMRSSSTDASSGYNLSAPAFNATSSRAIKRETGKPTRARDILARLRPILYRLLADESREQIGLIAEEVHEVCPQLSDGKTVSYDRLALLLLADWQESRGLAAA